LGCSSWSPSSLTTVLTSLEDVDRKVAQLLELTETLHVAVGPILVVERQLWVVVVGIPRLSPPSSQTWQDVERKVVQLLELTETPHVVVGPVLVC
jgi:hypothetical protein